MVVGAIFGGSYGFANSLRNTNGVVWRTTVGVVGGGVLGFTVGLFPFHAFGLLFIGDCANTGFEYYKNKNKLNLNSLHIYGHKNRLRTKIFKI